jgi:hypothetical protein
MRPKPSSRRLICLLRLPARLFECEAERRAEGPNLIIHPLPLFLLIIIVILAATTTQPTSSVLICTGLSSVHVTILKPDFLQIA